MAGNFVNPLSSVGGFQNQQLARFTAPNSRTPLPGMPGSPDSQMPSMEGFGKISDRATRQHNMYLQALQAQQARQQPKVSPTSSYGGGGYSGGRGGAGGPLVGRYNMLAGADQALQAMNAAFRKQFGYDMKIVSGGRSYEEQKRLYDGYKRGLPGYNLAARPGTSLHESGRAVDFGGALHSSGTREHDWLVQNAGRWGFKWTGKNFKQFEPWHFEWWG